MGGDARIGSLGHDKAVVFMTSWSLCRPSQAVIHCRWGRAPETLSRTIGNSLTDNCRRKESHFCLGCAHTLVDGPTSVCMRAGLIEFSELFKDIEDT